MEFNGKRYANLEELEPDAKELLTTSAYNYYASGAETESTLAENRQAFSRYKFLPRILVDVSSVDTSCNILGLDLKMPVIIAPMAMQKMAHKDGEVAMTNAATAAGAGMALSTMATTSLEEVADTKCPNLWYQIYVLTRRDVTESQIKMAESAGYKALVITVDAPKLGKRDADVRNKFALPDHLSLKMLERISAQAAAGGGHDEEIGDSSKFMEHFSKLVDSSLTWEFIPWVKSITKLPVIVKGILAPDDARRAVEFGADGIIVSNHGGRQLDFTPATIDVLPAIVRAVREQERKIAIMVDGGIRRGTDVLKCLALGADAVMIGRPMLWALTLGGKEGVEAALEVLKHEIELGTALLGCRSLAEVNKDYIIMPNDGIRLPETRL